MANRVAVPRGKAGKGKMGMEGRAKCMVKGENNIFGGEGYCSVYRSQSVMWYT